MVYRTYTFRIGLLFVAIICIFLSIPGRRHMLSPDASLVFRIIGGMCAVLGLLCQQKAMVDIDRKEVRTVAGIWPALGVKVYPFSDCEMVVASVRVTQGRYGPNYYFPISIMLRSGGYVQIEEFSYSDDAFNAGLQIADIIGVQLQNLTSGASW